VVSPSSLKVINAPLYEYYVIKSGYDKNRLTKQNHSVLNTDRQGKLLNKNLSTKIHNLSNHPREYNLAVCTVDGKNNGNSCERCTFINVELGHHLPVTQLVSFLE